MKKNLKKAERFVRSYFRKLYERRLIIRCAVLLAALLQYLLAPEAFAVLRGFAFFHSFSWLHVLWALWVFDMTLQLVPAGKYWPLGSQKFLAKNFRAIAGALTDGKRLMQFVRKNARDTLLVAGAWTAIMAVVWGVYRFFRLGDGGLFVATAAFYVCDVICVLYWCPFRVWIMKNRCCTTCRIFNWDHIMMFSPFVFIPGFYTWSLFAMALFVFVMWEVTFYMHPERFWEDANESLRCQNCTDILCGKRNCDALSGNR